MKKTLKISVLVLVIVMFGLLTSCGGRSESSSTHNWSEESVITEEVITETIIYEEVIR